MYIPLYIKTNYSLLSSLLKIDDIVEYAKTNNIPSCAICDDFMYGTMEFIKKCNSNNIKPVIGLTVDMEDITIALFAKNYNGYKSLIKLATAKSKDKLTYDDLKKYNNDLISIITNDKIVNKEIYNNLSKIYNEIYLGFSNIKEENRLKKISNNVVFFKKSLYKHKKDYEYLKYLYLIRDGKTIYDDTSYDLVDYELYIDTYESLSSREGLTNTYKIINECNIEFPKRKLLLPIYKDTKGMNREDYLFELCKVGLNKRLNNKVSDTYKKRLSYELSIINQMGFCNYFLVVYDFIKFAKKNNILVGPGRGSAAGSLVSYSLGITDIDPLQYDLLFERFLNPERKTMPDIDTDFPDDRRDEVINYVIEKYGKKNVAGIVTFGTLSLKQVIRDTSRALGIPIYKVDSLAKFIPNFTKDNIEEFYRKNEVFKAKVDSDKDLTKMLNIAKKIEKFPRHTSSHAAGIIMSEQELDEIIPLTYSDNSYLSSYTMEYLEELGLLKMDFLGLKNLSIINNILNDIEKYYNEKIDFLKIPLDDKKALEVFSNADTCGIFQFESAGMRNFLKKLKPDSFEDIFAAIALFRPGPASNIDTYIKRKKGYEKITYLDPCLEGILKNTYGILIYQEQIIQVANIYAGYSLGEADILRRAMSKKKVDLLKKEEERFIKKSLEMGRDLEKSKKIFSLILNFAGYGFNRSHSVAYSLIAYKMAYLKVRYKTIFFANLLNNVIGSESKTKDYIEEAKANNIKVLRPDINLSTDKYVVNNNEIIYPFSNLKSVGIVSAKAILKARKEPFVDIYDAFSKLIIEHVPVNVIESLIYSDCFSRFGYNKKTLIKNLDSLINYAELTKDLDLSLVMKPDILESNEFSDKEQLQKEKEIFGFYLSHHPTTNYFYDNKDVIKIEDITKYFNKDVYILLLVERIKVINTKRGEEMCFIDGSDETGMIDITVFPKTYKLYSNIKRGDIIKVYGKVEKQYNEYKLIAKKIIYLNGDSDEK